MMNSSRGGRFCGGILLLCSDSVTKQYNAFSFRKNRIFCDLSFTSHKIFVCTSTFGTQISISTLANIFALLMLERMAK